ncbi:hypothetical protein AB0K40_23500 [Nonomuraea bangladeshensis]|uniref:Uncharacterized protein n=1 Tax=Nonomuraea bangladeshensis TaxID=404385 RepID=A0ABV3H7I3_9ACTN
MTVQLTVSGRADVLGEALVVASFGDRTTSEESDDDRVSMATRSMLASGGLSEAASRFFIADPVP